MNEITEGMKAEPMAYAVMYSDENGDYQVLATLEDAQDFADSHYMYDDDVEVNPEIVPLFAGPELSALREENARLQRENQLLREGLSGCRTFVESARTMQMIVPDQYSQDAMRHFDQIAEVVAPLLDGHRLKHLIKLDYEVDYVRAMNARLDEQVSTMAFDRARLIAWLDSHDRKPPELAFTSGHEREIADRFAAIHKRYLDTLVNAELLNSQLSEAHKQIGELTGKLETCEQYQLVEEWRKKCERLEWSMEIVRESLLLDSVQQIKAALLEAFEVAKDTTNGR